MHCIEERGPKILRQAPSQSHKLMIVSKSEFSCKRFRLTTNDLNFCYVISRQWVKKTLQICNQASNLCRKVNACLKMSAFRYKIITSLLLHNSRVSSSFLLLRNTCIHCYTGVIKRSGTKDYSSQQN